MAASDTTLSSLSAAPDRVFASVFGAWPGTYRLQPAALRLTCPGGGCRQALTDLALANPGRVLWVDGNLTLESDGDIGSAAEPVTLVVTRGQRHGSGGTGVRVRLHARRLAPVPAPCRAPCSPTARSRTPRRPASSTTARCWR